MEIEKSKKDFVPSNVFGEDILISDNTNFEFEVKKFLNNGCHRIKCDSHFHR